MRKFWVSTDSTCDLYQSYIKEHDVWFVPLNFMIEYKDGKMEEYVDQFENYGEYVDFYGKLRSGGYSRTAMLNYEAHYNHFLKMAQAGAKDVVHFTISSGLSPTVTVANKAAAEVKKDYPDFTVYAVDPLTATIGQGILVQVAVRLADEGKTAEETYNYVMGLRLNIQHCIIPDDLFYLQKGGRVSAASAVMGSMLNIKPFLTFDNDGKLKVIDKCKGMKKAFSKAMEKLEKCPISEEEPLIVVVHTDNEEKANELAALIEAKCGVKPQMCIMGPVIGSHVGPGSVSCGWISTKTRSEF